MFNLHLLIRFDITLSLYRFNVFLKLIKQQGRTLKTCVDNALTKTYNVVSVLFIRHCKFLFLFLGAHNFF